ncbi:MAG: hypothetical protein N2249_01790 [Melioribacter sp.]|nr:hypothetical protein [Melioribacter sp.]
MKRLCLIFIIAIYCASNMYSQPEGGMPGKKFMPDGKALRKIEQLEKSKLIELLNLDENTSIRFFAKRNEHFQKVRTLFDEREKIINELKNSLDENKGNDNFYKEQVNKLLENEDKMVNERESYYKSLSSILTPQQLAKLAVFEFMFRKELAHTMMKRMRKEKE